MAGTDSRPRRSCVGCHRPIRDDANVCPHCGHDYRPVMSGHAWEGVDTPLPPLGGALIAYAGFVDAVAALVWWAISSDFDWSALDSGNMLFIMLLGLVSIAVGGVGIAGGVYAMTRRRLSLALISGAAAIAGGGLLSIYSVAVLAPMTMALIGVLLIAIARREFID